MAIKTLSVGIGLGGSKFTKELAASAVNTKAYYLNISTDELSKFQGNPNAQCIAIGATDGGAGKDREVAKNHFTESFDHAKLITEIIDKSVAEEVDIINVAFSLGGGTGSGIGPVLTEKLREAAELCEKRKIIVFGIALLPMMAEGLKSFKNALLAMKDMIADMANGGRYALVKNAEIDAIGDNQSERHMLSNKKTVAAYEKYLTGTSKPSENGVLDLNDRRAGFEVDGLHAFFQLSDGQIVESGFVGPNSDIVVSIINAEVPVCDAKLYEKIFYEKMQKLEIKCGYTDEEDGSVGLHGFGGLGKIAADLRERLEDIKKESYKADSATGRNAFDDLDVEVVKFKPGSRFAKVEAKPAAKPKP